MTQSRYARLARTAGPDLLALMATRPVWNLEQLSTPLKLDAGVVQHVLGDLLAQGEIRTRFIVSDPEASPAPHYSLNRVRPLARPPRPLIPLEERVLAFLLGRKETLGTLCTALGHPKSKVVLALARLDEQELITCTFVGHLPLFSLPLPPASSIQTA